jgi:hypothetical protein
LNRGLRGLVNLTTSIIFITFVRVIAGSSAFLIRLETPLFFVSLLIRTVSFSLLLRDQNREPRRQSLRMTSAATIWQSLHRIVDVGAPMAQAT